MGGQHEKVEMFRKILNTLKTASMDYIDIEEKKIVRDICLEHGYNVKTAQGYINALIDLKQIHRKDGYLYIKND